MSGYSGTWFGAAPSYISTWIGALASSVSFPTQYSGLRIWDGSQVLDLCLVSEADAPIGMGGVFKVDKGGTVYALYLVDTNDANASPLRIRTSTGVKSVRLKT